MPPSIMVGGNFFLVKTDDKINGFSIVPPDVWVWKMHFQNLMKALKRHFFMPTLKCFGQEIYQVSLSSEQINLKSAKCVT